MKNLILLVLPLILLVACTSARYAWEHEGQLGVQELKEDQGVCSVYAKRQIAPIYYSGYPYFPYSYGGYYSGHRGYRHHYHRHLYGQRGYYFQDYYGGYNTYAYQQDISRACMKGKGWNRVRIDEG